MPRLPADGGTMAAMKAFIGLLWGLGGMLLGGIVFGMGAALFASATHMSSREGASGYFIVALGVIGGALGLVAGLAWYARSAPAGEGFSQLGQGALGLAVFVAVLVAAGWGWMQSREVPVTYDGDTQANLLLEFRLPAASAPVTPARRWLNVEVTTANTRPEALVLQDEVRRDGDHLIVPAIQGPLVRSGSRLVVARLELPGVARDEVFMPPMPRRPDPKADWSEWQSPRQVFDARSGATGGPAMLQMRWRLRLYGE